jgi:hypothetical protein
MSYVDLGALQVGAYQLEVERKRQAEEMATKQEKERLANLEHPFIQKVVNTALSKKDAIVQQSPNQPQVKRFYHLKSEDDKVLYLRTKDQLQLEIQKQFGQNTSIYQSRKETQEWSIRSREDDSYGSVYYKYEPYLFLAWDGRQREDGNLKEEKKVIGSFQNPYYVPIDWSCERS